VYERVRGGQGDAMDHVVNEQRDKSLRHPRCVFQIVRQHLARYTPEIVEQICGVPRATFQPQRRAARAR
jgi:anaerobic selenocysteine-containing dehydrogenase